MKPDITKLRQPSRADLIQAIAHAVLYSRGTKRQHDFDQFAMKVAAEKLIDGLERSNYVIMQGPPALGGAPSKSVRAVAERYAGPTTPDT